MKERYRVEGRGFQVFGEPVHRLFAEYLADLEDGRTEVTSPSPALKKLRHPHRGVFLFYPVREKEKGAVSIGFELLFPKNGLPFDIHFTVRRRTAESEVVV